MIIKLRNNIKKERYKMNEFNKVKEANIETLELYVPIVERVHGKEHPEFHDVARIFEAMKDKLQKAGNERPDLDEEFKQLREVTHNYRIPEDTCESYEAVYNILAELDKAYK